MKHTQPQIILVTAPQTFSTIGERDKHDQETTAQVAMHTMGAASTVYVWAARGPKWARITTTACTLTVVALDAYLLGRWLRTR